MAVTVNGSTTNTTSTSSTVTYSHTVNSGDYPLLIVGIATRGGPIASVTFDGDALTQRVARYQDSNTGIAAELWYMVGPTAKTANIVITRSYTNNTQVVVSCATNYYGVDQDDTFGGWYSDNWSGSYAEILAYSYQVESGGGMIFDALAFPDNGSGATPAADSGQTELYVSGTTGDTRGCFSYRTAVTDEENMGWTIRSEAWYIVCAAVYEVNIPANPLETVDRLWTQSTTETISGKALFQDTVDRITINSYTNFSVSGGANFLETVDRLWIQPTTESFVFEVNVSDSVSRLSLNRSTEVITAEQAWGSQTPIETGWQSSSSSSTTWSNSSPVETGWSDV